MFLQWTLQLEYCDKDTKQKPDRSRHQGKQIYNYKQVE